MRARSLFLAVLAAGLLSTSACSESGPSAPAWDGTGTVVSKHYEKEYTETGGYFMDMGSGMQMWVDTSYEVPEEWVLTVKDAAGHTHAEETAKPIYERLEPGSHYHR